MTATINEQGYNWLLEKVAKLNGRGLGEPLVVAATKVLHPVVRTEAGDKIVKPGKEAGRPVVRHVPFYEVEISGEAPRIPGYEFVGVVEHLDDGNILKSAPGRELPAEYRESTPLCQHCGLVRRRSQTYVLSGPDGCVQVGRNCLADCVRSPDAAEHLLAWAGAIDEILGKLHEYAGDGGGEFYFSVKSLVRLSVAYSPQHAWVPASQPNPTAHLIAAYIRCPQTLTAGERALMDAVARLSVDVEAQHVHDWVTGVLGTADDDKLSNYEANLVVLFRQHVVTARHVALVCSAHRAYYRYKSEAERRSVVVGEHVGTVGERGEFPVVVEKVISLGLGDYGERFLVSMKDGAGNRLVWFTGENCDLEESPEPIWIKASVGKHDEYNGRRQTVVSRVKKIDGPTPPKVKKPRKAKS